MRKKPSIDSEVRPIGARALKSARDTLRPWLSGARVLDLFSGQGRLAHAAYEEGAASVTMVEKDRANGAPLMKLAEGAPELIRVEITDAFKFLARAAAAGERYDIVFADPPFPLWTPKFSKRLCEAVSLVLAPGSIFLVKHPARVLPSLEIHGFAEWKTTQFGESQLIYLKGK